MASNTHYVTKKILSYMLAVSLHEPKILQELREETSKLERSIMQISAEQGQLMRMLVQLIGARRAVEVGVFTGYSSLCIAMGMPDDGLIVACDVSEEWTRIARKYWQKAGVEDKIELHLAPATDTLYELLAQGQADTFDLAFIDADKENYDLYYEKCLTLLRPNGLMIIDNTLWEGKVIDPKATDPDTVAIKELNEKMHKDDRVEVLLLPISDGVTLVRKK